MPRNYQRKTDKGKWSAQQLKEAIIAVKNGMKIREAGREFNVPESTIRKKIKLGDSVNLDESCHLGKFTIFSKEQENELSTHVLKLAKMFHGLSTTQFRKLAYEYAEANKIKNNFNKQTKMAGKDWYYGFLKRHAEISLRKPESTSLNRIRAFNKDAVQLFFKNLDELYEKYKFKEQQIFNVDESGITTVHTPVKCLGPKGIKQFGSKTSGERGKNVTVICCFNAAGTYIPPMFIFPRKRMTNMLEKNGPAGAIYSCSPTGWSNDELFLRWLKHFSLFAKPTPEEPVLVILDNHCSHISLNIYEFCKSTGIVLLTLPPHTSHKLQPLDVTFFGPLKTAYNKECHLYLRNAERITTYEIAEIFNKSYIQVATMDKAISGFNVWGIHPFQPNKFTEDDFSTFFPVTADAESAVPIDLEENNNTPSGSSTTAAVSPFISNVETAVRVTEANNTTSAALTGSAYREVSPQPSTSKHTESPNVSVSDLLPLPRSICNTRKSIKVQKSTILTTTPNKEELQLAEKRRKERRATLKQKTVSTPVRKQKVKGSNTLKRKLFKTQKNESEEDECDSNLSENGEDCLVCGDGVRKQDELWFRCTGCSLWAHALCSGWNSPSNYLCDFCSEN